MSWKMLVYLSPVYNEKDSHDESNYRPVSILLLLSKLFERILNKQIDSYTKDILSKYLGDFWKKFSSQQSLLATFEKSKKLLSKSTTF